MTTALVIPTVREKSILRFFNNWKISNEVVVFVIEDNPTKTFNLDVVGRPDHLIHVSWKEIDEDLKDKSWIIPRRTDCIRSYGFYLAYKQKFDCILTLDDDCYRADSDESFDVFLNRHYDNLNWQPTKWVSTIKELKPRGMPFKNRGERKVVLNMGFWNNVPDLDAPTHLAWKWDSYNANIFKPVPPNYFFPMSGMNLIFRREITPMMYFMLMGQGYKYDRFGDIWCGIIAKKICDHLGYAVTAGSPSVNHDKASSVWNNLRKETEALYENEYFWESIDKIELKGKNAVDCYLEIAESFKGEDKYFNKLSEAMKVWVDILK